MPQRTVWQDLLARSHPMMLLPVLCLALIGTFLAPQINYLKLGLLIYGLICGVGLAAYRINTVKDGGSVLSDEYNLIIAAGGLAGYILFVIASTALWGFPVLIMGVLGLFAIAGYNGLKNKYIHNSITYGLCWGLFPVVLAYCFQTLSWPSVPVIIFGIGAAIYARLATWLWGPTTCGIWLLCYNSGRCKPGVYAGTTCHSNTIKCQDRLVMPKEVSEHMKLMIKLNDGVLIFFTLGIILLHFMGG